MRLLLAWAAGVTGGRCAAAAGRGGGTFFDGREKSVVEMTDTFHRIFETKQHTSIYRPPAMDVE